MPLVRLDKILTDTGLCSRSQAREIIRRGRAAVNGTPCADPAAKFAQIGRASCRERV